MKKTLLLILTLCFFDLDIQSVEAKTYTASTEMQTTDKTTYKRKRHRKKRGFLWGLFKKKNPCGCPNH